MSNIELVLADVDGTLVQAGTDRARPAVCESIAEVQGKDVEITLVTGRPREMVEGLCSSLELKGHAILDAGASIRDLETGQLAWSNWLDVYRLKEIAKQVMPHAVTIDFFPVRHEVSPSETSLEDIIVPAPYVFAFIDEEAKDEVAEHLNQIPHLYVHFGPGRDDLKGIADVQITDALSTKFHAIDALRQIVHSDKGSSLAIGDALSDLPMFRNSGFRVAMGNAVPLLKEEADFVVADVLSDGFAEAMHKFVLK